MLKQIEWGRGAVDEARNPFADATRSRPVRLTLDMPSLRTLQDDEQAALDLLTEFAALSDVDILSVEPGSFPHISFGALDSHEQGIIVTITTGHRETATLTSPVDSLRSDARRVEGRRSLSSNDILPSFDTIIRADAHVAFGRDLFVTLSPWLLQPKEAITLVKRANPCSPKEAARLLGLLLRARGKVVLTAGKFMRSYSDVQSFYYVLTKYLVPSMANHAINLGNIPFLHNKHQILSLLDTISMRCARALQARDIIGEMFYAPQNSTTRAMMMYHFDYISLLLSGALDSLALYVYRSFQFSKPKNENRVDFRNPEFQTELAFRAPSLKALLQKNDFSSLREIVAELRNTIHGDTHGVDIIIKGTSGFSDSDELYLNPPGERGIKIWQAVQQHTRASDWGVYQYSLNFMEENGSVRKEIRIRVEPYTCALTLLRETLALIDSFLTEMATVSPAYSGCMASHTFHQQVQYSSVQERSRILLLGS